MFLAAVLALSVGSVSFAEEAVSAKPAEVKEVKKEEKKDEKVPVKESKVAKKEIKKEEKKEEASAKK